MATQTLFFTGKTKWFKRDPGKYDAWEVLVYLDTAEMNKYKDSGLQLQVKEDSDGKYVTFRRKTVEYIPWEKKHEQNSPPDIKIKKGNQYVDYPTGYVGNGSTITVKIEAYDTPRRGPGTKGHRLLAVAIEDLVEYNPEATADTGDRQPRIQMPF